MEPTLSPPWADELPAPLDKLLELGLTLDEVEKAWRSKPLVIANHAKAFGGEFDVRRVKRVLNSLAAFRHTKGIWAGKPISLEDGGLAPWQVVWIIAPVFGWVRHDPDLDRDVRVVRKVWIEVPRKNGKSTISAGLANVLFLADDEPGAEVYAAATSLEQAGRVYDDARSMIRTSEAAVDRVQILKQVMHEKYNDGVFRVLSRVAEAAHGLNVSGAVIDEVHVHKTRGLIDAIETGTGARTQPLIIMITTADEAVEGSIYDEKHAYTEKCASGVIVNPAHYGVIWAAEEADDPFAESTWRKANPGLGVSPSLAALREAADIARTTPTSLPTFKQLYLNLRTKSQRRLFDLKKWDSAGGIVDLARLKGQRAWSGLDLSAVSDLSAWCLVVDSPRGEGVEAELLWRYWVPEDRVVDLERQLQVPLSQWVKQGFVTATEGDVIDYDAIEAQVIADAKHLDMKRVSFDRMFAGQMVQRIDKALRGCDVVPVAQTFMGTSPGIKELLRLLGASKDGENLPLVRHAGDPVTRWMASVVEAKDDGNDNLRLAKPERAVSQARIDGIAAAVMALDGYLRRPMKRQPITVYRQSG